MKRSKSDFANLILCVGFIGLLFLLLVGYAWKGTYSRYLQDDYCYGAEVVRLGFFPAQIDSYLNPMPYNSNRYSLTLSSGIAELLGGPAFSPFITALALLGWAAAFFYAARQLRKLRQEAGDGWTTAIGIMVILFFSILLAPSQYQVVFWRSAMLPYLIPLIFTVFTLGRCMALAQRESFSWLDGLWIGLLSFIAGGFSETVAAWQFALCGLLFFFTLYYRISWKRIYLALLWVLGGTGLAILVLAICPANAQRIQSLGLQQPNFLVLIGKTLQFGYTEIRYSIRTELLDFIVIMTLGFWLGWQNKNAVKTPLPQVLLAGAAAGLACYLLVFADALPTMYTMSSPPDGRALFPAQVSMIVAVFYAGWLAAQFLFSLKPQWKPKGFVNGLSFVLGVLLFGYLLTCFPRVYNGLSAYQSRAHYWDLRQELIRDSVKAGQQDLQVPQFNSISQVAELRPDAHYWVNVCAARYYQVHTLTAIEGLGGFPSDFK